MKLFFSLILSFVITFSIFSDFSFKDEYLKYNSDLELSGFQKRKTLIFHSLSSEKLTSIPGTPWENNSYFNYISNNPLFYSSGVENFLSYNSTYAHGKNDGAIWQGRGFNDQISVGMGYKFANLSIYLNPIFWFAQNSDFQILPGVCSSGFGDYYGLFDNLQRYGTDSFYQFDFGESEIRY